MTRRAIITSLLLASIWAIDAHAQDRRKHRRPRPAPPTEAKPKAEPAKDAAKPDEAEPPVQVEESGSGRKKDYRIKTEFVIEGRIQKPNAFYVLQRSNINYEWVDLKQQFTPRILQTVRESPF